MKISILSAKKQMSNQEAIIEVPKSQKVKKAVATKLQKKAVDVSFEVAVENLAHNAGVKTNKAELPKKKAVTVSNNSVREGEPKKPLPQKASVSLKETEALNLMIIDYSEKSIAVIGDTKCIKDELKALKGWFKLRLRPFGIELSVSGWIFPKKDSSEVEKLLSKYRK